MKMLIVAVALGYLVYPQSAFGQDFGRELPGVTNPGTRAPAYTAPANTGYQPTAYAPAPVAPSYNTSPVAPLPTTPAVAATVPVNVTVYQMQLVNTIYGPQYQNVPVTMTVNVPVNNTVAPTYTPFVAQPAPTTFLVPVATPVTNLVPATGFGGYGFTGNTMIINGGGWGGMGMGMAGMRMRMAVGRIGF